MQINTMLAAEDNRRFLANLIRSAGPNPQVFLDQAHLLPSNLDKAKETVVSVQRVVARPVPLAALIVIVTVTLLAPLWRRKGARLEAG